MARRFPPALIAVSVAILYYLGALLGFAFRLAPATTSVLWPPNALLTAALLLTPPRLWWLCIAAVLPAHMLAELGAGFPVSLILILFLTNCAEAGMAAALIYRWSDAPQRFDTLRRVSVFLVTALVAAPALSGFADAAAVALLRHEPYWLVWQRRLLSNALSALTLIPAAVTIFGEGAPWLRGSELRQRLEAVGLAAALFAIGAAVFGGHAFLTAHLPGAPYTSLAFLMPVLIWATVRFGPGGASLSLLATALLAIGAALSGWQPLGMIPAAERVVALQTFLTVVGVPLLLLGALIQERHQAADAVRRRLLFEGLLSQLSAAFVHLPSDRMDEEFPRWLQRVGQALDLERVELRQLSDERSAVRVHSWVAEGVDPQPLPMRQEAGWNSEAPLEGEVDEVDVSVDGMAGEPVRARVREMLWRNGSRWALTLPLVAGRAVLGSATFASGRSGSWPGPLARNWRLVADILASALARKRTEDALRESEAMKAAVLSSLTSQVAVLDRTGRVVVANDSWTRFLGDLASSEGRGAAGADYLSFWREAPASAALDPASAIAGIQGVLDGSLPYYSFEYPVWLLEGERWFLMTVVPLRALAGGAVVSVSEVTERRHAEAEAQRSRQELAHYLRVSTIGELTTSLAHELNQPLTAILANAQAAQRLIDQGADRAEIREALQDIVDEDKRAGEVIRRLRELLRKGVTERRPIEINGLVREVTGLLSSDAVIRKLALRFEPGLAAGEVIGDRVQLQQVVLNLVINAMEAMADDGAAERVVLVRTDGGPPGRVRVSVKDAGSGLPAHVTSRLFEPFFSTKSSGMGMGLPIARSIVEAHGGTISACNNPVRGATFSFVLPLSGGVPESSL